MTRVALVLLVLVAAPLGAQSQIRTGFRATHDVSLRIWVPVGLVRVVTWDRDSIGIDGVTGRNGKFFGGSSGSAAKLGIDARNANDVTLPGGDLTVSVPRRARVWIKMTAGHVDADGVAGELEVFVVGGSIAVRNASGVVSVESIDAPVTIDQASGSLRIRGGRGSVTLHDVDGTATIATVSGAVELSGARIPDSRVETIGGSITVDARPLRHGALDLQTHAGDITVIVDGAHVPLLDLVSRGGRVINPFIKAARGAPGITARSFKGAINVRAGSGVKGGKPVGSP